MQDESCLQKFNYFYEQKDIKYYKYFEDVVSAFSINWPYFAFAGLDYMLVIINVFDKELVHRF